MEPDKTPAGQPALSSRLYSYGMTAPKSLVARRPGSAPLDPLPGAERTGPSLRTRLPADAALSPSNALAASNASNSLFGETLASFASGGKQVGYNSQPDPALSSGPLPFNQLARDRQRKAALIRDPPPGFVDRTDMAGPPVAAPADDAPQRRDPFWFIQMLRTELSDHEFAYMNVADTDGTTWDPYNLQIVAFADVNPLDHYTISAAGVTHCLRKGKVRPEPNQRLAAYSKTKLHLDTLALRPRPTPNPDPHPHQEEMMEFTVLEQWERECGLFQQAILLPLFNRYLHPNPYPNPYPYPYPYP